MVVRREGGQADDLPGAQVHAALVLADVGIGAGLRADEVVPGQARARGRGLLRAARRGKDALAGHDAHEPLLLQHAVGLKDRVPAHVQERGHLPRRGQARARRRRAREQARAELVAQL